MLVASFVYWSSSVITTQSRTRHASAASTAAARTTRPATPASGRLFRRDVCSRDAAVDEEGRAVDVRRFVARKEERGVDDLARLRKPADGDVYEPPLRRLRIVAPDALQQRRLHRPGAERVHAD